MIVCRPARPDRSHDRKAVVSSKNASSGNFS
jgi:hypothetical protein